MMCSRRYSIIEVVATEKTENQTKGNKMKMKRKSVILIKQMAVCEKKIFLQFIFYEVTCRT